MSEERVWTDGDRRSALAALQRYEGAVQAVTRGTSFVWQPIEYEGVAIAGTAYRVQTENGLIDELELARAEVFDWMRGAKP